MSGSLSSSAVSNSIVSQRNGPTRHDRRRAAVKLGQQEFTWSAGKDLVVKADARTAYLAALRRYDANENDVKPLLTLHDHSSAVAAIQ